MRIPLANEFWTCFTITISIVQINQVLQPIQVLAIIKQTISWPWTKAYSYLSIAPSLTEMIWIVFTREQIRHSNDEL